MSHRFSSTFDALQAHFAKKQASTAAGSNAASQAQPPAGSPAPGQAPAPSPNPASVEQPHVQHAPVQSLGHPGGSSLPHLGVHSGSPYASATFAYAGAPAGNHLGMSNMPSGSHHLQPYRPQPQVEGPLLYGQHTHHTEQNVYDTNSMRPSLTPSLQHAAPPSHGSGFPDNSSAARYIAQAVNNFIDRNSATVQQQHSEVSSGNPLSQPPNQPPAAQDQTPLDTVVDPLLQRQLELSKLEEAGRKRDTQLDIALNDAVEPVPSNTEGAPRGTKRRNARSNRLLDEEERDSTLPSIRGRGRGTKRRGPRKAAEPTGDVKLRLNMASEAYLQGRIDDAIQLVEDAIRINAEIHRAWILLAQLFEEQGELRKRLTARICAAQLEPKNIDGWLSVAQQAVALREMHPDDADDLTRQAMFCYSGALRADVEHRSARHGRAALATDRGHFKGAAKDYTFLVDRLFYDIYALRGLAETTVLLAENSRRKQPTYTPEAAVAAYRRCIAHVRENGIDPEYPFEWDDVYIFVDLLGYVRQFKEAIYELKSLARWLLNRSEESYWDNLDDSLDDDREWDVDNTRRLEVPGFQEGRYPDTSYGNGLPLQLRTKLGVYRLELNQEDEAMRHLEWLDPTSGKVPELLSEYAQLVLEAASALYEKGKYSSALRFYEPLFNVPDVLDASALLGAGRCYLNIGDKRQAEECFTAAIDADELSYQPCIDARLELARMYEAAREEREAYILVSEAIKLQEAQEEEDPLDGDGNADDADEDDDELEPPNLSLTRGPHTGEKRKKLATRVLRMRGDKAKPRAPRLKPLQPKMQRQRPRVFGLSEEVQREEDRRSADLAAQWERVRTTRQESRPDDRGPPDIFMTAAGALVDDFRSYKDFYSWDSYLTHLGIKQVSQKPVTRNPNLVEMVERLSHNLGPGESGPAKPTSERYAVGYRGVPFNEWLDLFLEYAMGLAHRGKCIEAYKVCESARDAVVFSNSKEDLFLIHVTWAACALRGRDEETCVAIARYFTSKHQFDTDAFRMFAALSRLCPSPASWYASGPVQKFLLRQIRVMDTTLRPKQARREDSPGEDGTAEQTTYPGKELDSTLLTLYGHVLFISNSFTYALNYLLRALSLDPTNTMIALSIAQCYIQDGLKRQSDNRQYLIAQGCTFLHRYYEARISSLSPVPPLSPVSPLSPQSPAAAAAARQEAHYNLARTYHSIGIPHLAVEYYRRALQEVIPEEAEDEGMDVDMEGGGGGKSKRKNIMGSQDISREAAFNLQQLCFAGGDMETVRALGERYLVI